MGFEPESRLQTADVGVGGVVMSACVDLTSLGITKKREEKDFSQQCSLSMPESLIFSLSNWGMLNKSKAAQMGF